MSSFYGHFLVAKELLPTLNMPNIAANQNYFLVGSMGPDLPYYQNIFGSALDVFFEEQFNPDSPGLYSGPGDYFHSRTPNVLPMKLFEVIKKDKDPNTENQKLAFAFGYLTHMATDQHIHPLIESYAGGFYLSAVNRNKHRTLEVYQDLLLYRAKNPGKDFFEEDFPSWIDIGLPRQEIEIRRSSEEEPEESEKGFMPKKYTYKWFQCLIQRAYLEAYASLIDGEDVEKWIKGFNSIFKIMDKLGPYRSAQDNIDDQSDEAIAFEQMFNDPKQNYLVKYFEPAKQLARSYISVAKSFFEAKQVTGYERNEFLTKIPDADLGAPLMQL